MRSHRWLPSFLLLCLLVAAAPWAAARSAEPAGGDGMTVAVADFSGSDKELGRFLADTLLTDLAQSDRLHLAERSEIRQALTELKLQSTGLAEPQQVKRVGKLVGADRLIVGGYLLRGERIFVNARLLDVRTGRVMPGGAANVSGVRDDIIPLMHRLAQLLHRRVTGAALPGDGDSPDGAAPDDSTPLSAADTTAGKPTTGLETAQERGLIPSNARPNGRVSERAMLLLAQRVAQEQGNERVILAVLHPDQPVTRLRALGCLLKATLSRSELTAYEGRARRALPPDARQAPSWGLVFVAAAVDRGWWPAKRSLRPLDAATWAFVATVLDHMADQPPSDSAHLAAHHDFAPSRREADGCTGLIVDARSLPVERAMSVRILDEDGNVVYPDPHSLPSIDYLEDNGMAAYVTRPEEAGRAGERPLFVHALRTPSGATEDVVVSNETAERIRDANRHGRFLNQWKVCILLDDGR